MLPVGSRLSRRADFTSTLRQARGVRAGGLLVVHRTGPPEGAAAAEPAEIEPAKVGFVVSRAVGPAVTRNLVRRRLRHLAAGRLDRLPAGSLTVVRALPASASATYAELDAALGRALGTGRA